MSVFFQPSQKSNSPEDGSFFYMSPPKPPSPDEVFDKFNESFNWIAAAAFVSSILGTVLLAVLAFAIINCLRQAVIPMMYQYQMKKGEGVAAVTPAYTSIPNSDIEMGTMEKFIVDIEKEKPVRLSPQELVRITNDYSTRLGSGGFGVVYKGEFPNGVQVAVKLLNKSLDKRMEQQFMAEVGTIGRTYHINLVRLYGFCYDATTKALVYEYMENGSLDRYLFKSQRMDWEKLHEVAIGTAKGIAYLHEECNQTIIHYDIKPGNILLDANFSPKVADFGLAKLCERENAQMTLTGVRGTPGYTAPELWLPYPVTYKCDVYSFGMLLFEIVGRRKNLEVNLTESQEWFPRWVWEKFDAGELQEIISVCGIEEKDREKAERMCMVALWCVQYQAEARPKMSRVVKLLEGGAEIVAPVNPFLHLVSSGAAGLGGWSESNESSTTATETTTGTKYKDFSRNQEEVQDRTA